MIRRSHMKTPLSPNTPSSTLDSYLQLSQMSSELQQSTHNSEKNNPILKIRSEKTNQPSSTHLEQSSQTEFPFIFNDEIKFTNERNEPLEIQRFLANVFTEKKKTKEQRILVSVDRSSETGKIQNGKDFFKNITTSFKSSFRILSQSQNEQSQLKTLLKQILRKSPEKASEQEKLQQNSRGKRKKQFKQQEQQQYKYKQSLNRADLIKCIQCLSRSQQTQKFVITQLTKMKSKRFIQIEAEPNETKLQHAKLKQIYQIASRNDLNYEIKLEFEDFVSQALLLKKQANKIVYTAYLNFIFFIFKKNLQTDQDLNKYSQVNVIAAAFPDLKFQENYKELLKIYRLSQNKKVENIQAENLPKKKRKRNESQNQNKQLEKNRVNVSFEPSASNKSPNFQNNQDSQPRSDFFGSPPIFDLVNDSNISGQCGFVFRL